jgi:transcription elongation factor Elf1
MGAVEYIGRWADRERKKKLRHRFGGIQTCPWCRQIAQSSGDWRFEEWLRDPMLDVLTCGVCGGSSLWRFELGMIYIGPLEAPRPSNPGVDFYDIKAARLISK